MCVCVCAYLCVRVCVCVCMCVQAASGKGSEGMSVTESEEEERGRGNNFAEAWELVSPRNPEKEVRVCVCVGVGGCECGWSSIECGRWNLEGVQSCQMSHVSMWQMDSGRPAIMCAACLYRLKSAVFHHISHGKLHP